MTRASCGLAFYESCISEQHRRQRPTLKAYCTRLQFPNSCLTHFGISKKEESWSLVKDSQRRWVVLRHFHLSQIWNITQRWPSLLNKSGSVGCVWQDVTRPCLHAVLHKAKGGSPKTTADLASFYTWRKIKNPTVFLKTPMRQKHTET